MSTLRQEYEDLVRTLKIDGEAFDQFNRLYYEQREPKELRLNELKREMILTENLLKNGVKRWKLQVWEGGTRGRHVYLTADEDSMHPEGELKKLCDLCQYSYHNDFRLMDGVDLAFNDGDISIRFEDPRKITSFVEKFDLTVDTSEIRGLAENLQNVVDSLWDLNIYATRMPL